MEEHTFEGILDFNVTPFDQIKAAGCCQVKIEYQEAARNGAINTGNPGNFFADAMIDICKASCNNSPTFTNQAIAYLCCNQPVYFNNGVSDTLDYDSLSYDLVPAKESDYSLFIYGAGYSATQPLSVYKIPSNPSLVNPNAKPPIGITLDKTSGDLIFTPTGCNEVGPIVIQISEWRKNSAGVYQKIAETRRDIQFVVRNCPGNNPPEIAGPYAYSVCEGTTLCFNINTTDKPFILPPPQVTPPPDTVTATWNNGIPGASFTITNPAAREKVAQFCWTPPIGKASSLPYTFTVTAKDNSCFPAPASSIRSFKVTVKPLAVAQRVYEVLKCGKFRLHAEPNDNYVNSFRWEVKDINGAFATSAQVNKFLIMKQTDTLQFRKGGKYIINLSVNNTYNCPNLYQDTIEVPPLLEVDLALGQDTFVCAGSSITLNAQVKNGVPDFHYLWATSANDTLSSLQLTPTANMRTSVVVTDKNGCQNSDTINIAYKPLPIVNLGPDKRICDYDSTSFDAGNPTMKWTWNTGDTTQQITIRNAQKYIVTVRDTFNCVTKDTAELFVNRHVDADLGSDRVICFGDTLKIGAAIIDTTNGKTHNSEWYYLDGAFIGTDDTMYFHPTGDKEYQFVLREQEGGVECVDYDTVKLRVNPLPTLTRGVLDDRCFNYGTVNFAIEQAFLPAGGKYYYMRDTLLMPDRRSIKTWELNPTPTITNDAWITYIYQDPATTCFNRDSIRQRILKIPTVILKDSTYCQNLAIIPLKNHVLAPIIINGVQSWTCVDNPGAVSTNASGEFFLDITQDPAPFQYTLIYKYKDGGGCENTDTIFISVIDVPVIQFTDPGAFCTNAGQQNLSTVTAVQPTGGKWYCRDNPAMVINNEIMDPAVSTGTFWFRYEHDLTGCMVIDSLQITINPLPMITTGIPAGMDSTCTSEAIFTMDYYPTGQGAEWSSAYTGLITADGRVNPSKKPDDNQLVGAYKLNFKYTDPGTGCISYDSQTIYIQSPPEVTIMSDKPEQCQGNDYTLHATQKNTASIVWTSSGNGPFNSTTQPDVVYTPSTGDDNNRSVTITVSSANHLGGTAGNGACPVAMASQLLTINPNPVFTFGSPSVGCAPLDVQFNDTVTVPATGFNYAWNFGDDGSPDNTSTQADPLHQYLKEGSYNVTLQVTTDKGCSTLIRKNNYVAVYPVPVADFDIDPADGFTTIALPKFGFINNSNVTTGTLKYLWDFNDHTKDPNDTSTLKDPIYFYSSEVKDTGEYVVDLYVTTDRGCVDQFSRKVRIGPDLTVFIPNAFSPNGSGEGLNEVFRVHAMGFTNFEMIIYNRWGEKMYETKDIESPWDGMYKGKPAQQDVYVYQVKVVSFSGKDI